MSTPRVLEIDLGRPDRAPGVRDARFRERVHERIASWGGNALGLALLHRAARLDPAAESALVLAAGEAVREGLPTAARASVLARAPLSGLYSEGHVGGELGPVLATISDALVLRGRAPAPLSVLRVRADGTHALLARPDLSGLSPARTIAALEDELGPCGVLAIGPGGERGLPFASLASGSGKPSFVGRGGLGAVLGRIGLKALVLEGAAPAPARSARAQALLERLSHSPRLAARAAGGTHELFEALAARGGAQAEPGGLSAATARALGAEARERAAQRSGCRGCPTPCGWVFERSSGERQGARFGASLALGAALGLASFDDALGLLARCDELGVDAKEVGAILALLARAQERGLLAGPRLAGDRDALARAIDALVLGEPADAVPELAGVASSARAGSVALARALGLESEHPASRGQAARAESSAAALLGACVASGGADPMRSFPFLVESAPRELLERLVAPLPLPPGAEDPAASAGKGRLVFWHENLVSAVDMSGFCAFSSAGLLADELADLDLLASWILPEALRAPDDPAWRELSPGERLLAAGANLVLLRRELNRLFGAAADQDRPAWARERLLQPGMLDEYLALRGLDERGRPDAAALARLGTPGLLGFALERARSRPEPARPETPRGANGRPPEPRPGRVTLRGSAALGTALGAGVAIELALPATLRRVLEQAAAQERALAPRLFAGERVIPAAWRSGRRLALGDEVEDGDVLDLVTAISGG